MTKLKKNILINGGFVLALLILAIIATLSYINMLGMIEEERWEHHTFDVSREFDDLLLALKEVETGELAIVFTGRETLLLPYNKALAEIEQKLAKLKTMMKDDSRHENHMDGIEPLIREKLAITAKAVELGSSRGFQAAYQVLSLDRNKELMDEIFRRVTAARSEEEHLLAELYKSETVSISKAQLAIVSGSIISFALLFMIFLLLRKETGQRDKAEQELLKHQDHLEEMVRMRTLLLEEAKHEAEFANSAKSLFLTNISHEMLTPLSGIMGVVDVMLTEKLTTEHQYNMELAKLSAESLKILINNILDFSRLTTGKISFDKQPFDLHRCIRGVTDVFALQAKDKGVGFLLEIDDSVPVLMTGDELRLRQVLDNLLSNALKFTTKGEICVSVNSSHDPSLPEQAILCFSVRDTGTGIPAEYMGNIFDIFTQADASSTKKFSGAGIGLALTKMIVENLGGKISCVSRAGEGSTFSFTLPLG